MFLLDSLLVNEGTSAAINIASEDFASSKLLLHGIFVRITSPFQVQVMEGVFLWNLKHDQAIFLSRYPPEQPETIITLR